MEWHVTFYSEKVENKTLSFPKGILANLLHIIEMIEEFGSSLGMPYTAPMGHGLFEIRAKGKEGIGRSLFCTVKGERNYNHSFICQKITKDSKKRFRYCHQAYERGEKMTRSTFTTFKEKALRNPQVKDEYEYLSAAYELRKEMIRLRKMAGLTQEKLAELLHTKKSNISRLESVNSNMSPKLSTIEEYAKAIGYKIKINFVPNNTGNHITN